MSTSRPVNAIRAAGAAAPAVGINRRWSGLIHRPKKTASLRYVGDGRLNGGRGVIFLGSYRFGEWRKACSALDLKHIHTSPYTPRTNGKAERFIKTLLGEWAYAMPFKSSQERNHWLPRYLDIYHGRRCHKALGGLSPKQCLQRLLVANDLERKHI